MKTVDLVRVLDTIIPGACPEIPTGPPSLIRGTVQAPYIIEYGALPPHWDEERRLTFECCRDDSVMIMWRTLATTNQRAAAQRWLRRHGLNDHGRPFAWDHKTSAERATDLALAG